MKERTLSVHDSNDFETMFDELKEILADFGIELEGKRDERYFDLTFKQK